MLKVIFGIWQYLSNENKTFSFPGTHIYGGHTEKAELSSYMRLGLTRSLSGCAGSSQTIQNVKRKNDPYGSFFLLGAFILTSFEWLLPMYENRVTMSN